MHPRERVVRERFAEQACRHCGAHYPPTCVVVLARRPAAWMVMATCDRCERRALFLVTFPRGHTGVPLIQPDDPHLLARSFPPLPPRRPALPSPQPPSPRVPLLPDATAHSSPVTDDDVCAMRDFLVHFDGDFHALFAGRHSRRPDDGASA